jgi:hypothetical protein
LLELGVQWLSHATFSCTIRAWVTTKIWVGWNWEFRSYHTGLHRVRPSPVRSDLFDIGRRARSYVIMCTSSITCK